jgi:hypothetical protein
MSIEKIDRLCEIVVNKTLIKTIRSLRLNVGRRIRRMIHFFIDHDGYDG